MSIVLPLAAQSQTLPTTGVVITEGDRLNLRDAPAADAQVLGKIEPQTQVEVLAASDDGAWYQVTVAGIGTGWVSAAWVSLGSAPLSVLLVPTPTPAAGGGGAAVPRLGVAARLATTGPTTVTTTGAATAAPTPTTVTVAGATVEATVEATVAPTAAPVVTYNVPTAIIQPERMNVRGGPGTGFPVVGSAGQGDALEITGMNPVGDWYRVALNQAGDAGWLFGSLVQVGGPADAIPTLSEAELPAAPTPEPQAEVQAASAPPVVAAPPPAGGGSFGYGVQAHMLGGETGRAMDTTAGMGFNWIKQQVEWRLYAADPGAMGFADLSAIVNEASARGISVLFSVVNAPGWAREPGFDASVGGPPVDPATYAAFVGGMARTFCGTSLKAIEVWNEQNLHYEWGNKPLDPAEYMRLLAAAYGSIKAECPSMMVISGALTPAGSNPPFAMDDFAYLEGMYQNGLANYADGIGAHPSGYNVPASVRFEEACAAIQQSGNSFNGACDTPHHSWSFRSTMEGYRNIMNVYGDSNKRIWPTEFGWAAGGAFDPRYAYANDNSFEEQAAWTVEAYTMMRDWGWVGPAFLWNLNFRVVADGTEKAQWGIVSNDWSPLPVYNALKSMGK
ncbi:MAG: SH3 domain-containing protein [Caldilineaceae bacterium]|nr:SH3 domain-containing protein [Caldilineaceae bacterium]